MELKKVNKCKLRNKIIQKREVITVGKAQEKIANKKANKVIIAKCAFIKIEKTIYNAIVGF